MIKNVKFEDRTISWTGGFGKKIVVNTVYPIVSSAYVKDMLIFVEQDEDDLCTLSIYDERGNLLKSVKDNEKYQIGSIGTELNNTKIYIVIFEDGDNPFCYYYNREKNGFESAHSLY